MHLHVMGDIALICKEIESMHQTGLSKQRAFTKLSASPFNISDVYIFAAS